MRRITVCSFVMILTLATSAHAVVVFSDGFESYTDAGSPLDANLAGPNAVPNGGPGNPWFGPAPPNLRVVSAGGGLSSGAAGPHSGSQMVTASAASDFDQEWVNIANRFDPNGLNYFGNIALDWWFYDPTGPGNSNYRDYAALGNYAGASTASSSFLDYPTSDSNLNHTTVYQRLSLGASNPAGFNNTNYQARVVGATDGTASGNWFNVGTRSIGWHEGKIQLGAPNGASTTASFYIDGVDVLDHAVMTSGGVNVIELNAGFGTTSANFDDLTFSTTSGLSGDFNNDGRVDAADYVVWRQGLGSSFTQSDYDVWRANFGQPSGSGSGALANAAIPEPASVLLLPMGVLAICFRRHPAVS
jgi:hypothetical protein